MIMNNEIDIKACLGQSEICDDNLDPNHAAQVAISLDKDLKGDVLPHLWHWAFFVRSQPYAVLGPDGHPASGGFPTPIKGRSRMWAGGRIKFLHDLQIGVPAQRQSKVINAVEKDGKTGSLLFITVQHDYIQNGKICISEEQDIVYRTPAPPKLTGTKPAPDAAWRRAIHLDEVHLFRYSAVTFNGHRIHYDAPYARDVESYPGLVVHGPMIATLMLDSFVQANPDLQVKDMAYRGLRPLIAPLDFFVAGKIESENQVSLWAEQDGTLAHQAKLTVMAK